MKTGWTRKSYRREVTKEKRHAKKVKTQVSKWWGRTVQKILKAEQLERSRK